MDMSLEPPLSLSREVGLRPPSEVMRLARMGASFPTRLSFMRGLIRRMAGEKWSFRRTLFASRARAVTSKQVGAAIRPCRRMPGTRRAAGDERAPEGRLSHADDGCLWQRQVRSRRFPAGVQPSRARRALSRRNADRLH